MGCCCCRTRQAQDDDNDAVERRSETRGLLDRHDGLDDPLMSEVRVGKGSLFQCQSYFAFAASLQKTFFVRILPSFSFGFERASPRLKPCQPEAVIVL
jgi:hypothetical protein